MPEVAFHTALADKGAYACRLVRKAWHRQRQVVVCGAFERLQRLDQQLWTFEHAEFIPHLLLRRGAAPAPVLRRTPIWLAEAPTDAPARDVLVNLGPGWPEAYAEFERVIELVGDDADEIAAGRERWRRYRAAGALPVSARAASGSP